MAGIFQKTTLIMGFTLWLSAFHAPVSAQCVLADTAGVFDMPSLDKAPVFPGGDQALLKFVHETHFPPLDSTSLPPSRYVIQFIVETDGTVSNICALRNPDHPYTRVLMRRLAELPRFSPGAKAGRAVRTRFVFPVLFCFLD